MDTKLEGGGGLGVKASVADQLKKPLFAASLGGLTRNVVRKAKIYHAVGSS